MESSSRGPIFLAIVGPAGAGKSSISEKLISDHPSLNLSISATSRKPRANEKEGIHYHFLSRPDFEKRIAEGAFFEWEETHGNLYGTLKTTMENAISKKYDLLFDVDIRGALNLKRSYPSNGVIVFIVPPTPESLKERMEGRGSATEEEIKKRLGTAEKEYGIAKEHRKEIDYIVINDSFDAAYKEVTSILAAERARLARVDDKSVSLLMRV